MTPWGLYICVAGCANAYRPPVSGLSGVWLFNSSSRVTSAAMTISGMALIAQSVRTMRVFSGGSALDVVVNDNTSLCVASCGQVSGITIYGGAVVVSSGGVISSGRVYGGSAVVSAGGSFDEICATGGVISAVGASLRNVLITSPGSCRPSDGAIISGGTLYLAPNWSAAANFCNLTLSGGSGYYSSHATLSGVTMAGHLAIFTGGSANAITVVSGGSMFVSSGIVSGAIIVSGGITVSNGSALGIALSSGAILTIPETLYAGHPAVITGGGVMVSGGTASGVILTQSRLILSYGGVLSDAALKNGANVSALAGGNVNNVSGLSGSQSVCIALAGSGNGISGCRYIDCFGVMQNCLIGYNQSMTIATGGVGSNVVIFSGGNLIISSGGSGLDITSCAGATVSCRTGGLIQYKEG